jgi:phytol kinase
MMNPWLGMALVIVTLLVLMGGLRLWQTRGTPQPELIRKLLHIGMGSVTLSFPWLFNEAWPILVLGVLSVGGMLALRLVKGLKSSLGSVVSGVERVSLGEIYFPLAVGILFLLYLHEDPDQPARRQVLYCVPLLLLTLADAVAALIGVNYGKWHYTTSDGRKSTEGSLAFFLCAFFCVHVPLLLATDTGRLETLLIALLIAWLATMFEAISWAGLDNLALPLISYLLLRIYLNMDAVELGRRLGITAGLMLFVLVWRFQTTLQGSAVLGAFLVGYISWALGGWRWLLPPVILFLSYTLLSPRTQTNSRRIHNIHAVVCVSSAGLLWLFAYRILGNDSLEGQFLYLFTLSFAAHLAIIGIARLGSDYPQLSAPLLLVICVGEGWLLLFVPYLVLESFQTLPTRCVFCALLGVALAAVGFFVTQPHIHDCPLDTPRWLRQAAHAGLGSTVGLLPFYLS